MPFEEIGKNIPWVRISAKESIITICKTLRNFEQDRVRLYHDLSANLFGIEPSSALGYKVGLYGRIRCRRLPVEGKFEAYWNNEKNMIIVDLTKHL